MQQAVLQQVQYRHRKNRSETFNETFDSSLIQKNQKYTLDKSLVQGIKNNDPSKIVENGEDADLGNINEIYDQQKQVSTVFVNTRKKYDSLKLTTNKVEQSVSRLKNQKQLLQVEYKKWIDSLSEEQKEYRNIQQQMTKISQMYDSAKYAKDCRLQMADVLKKDILVYKKQCFESNIKIVRNINKLKSLKGQHENTTLLSSTCKSLIKNIDFNVSLKESQRIEKINSYYDVINKKVQNSQIKKNREDRANLSMEQAMNSKMPQEKEQLKLLAVNEMLKKMLKMKMNREMLKYQETEKLFRQIKQRSTVKKADDFVERFMTREKTYGDLLDGISKCQRKISQLKQQSQQLQAQKQKLYQQKIDLQDLELQKNQKLTQTERTDMNQISEILLKNETLRNKAYSWAIRFISAFDNAKLSQVQAKISRKNIGQILDQSLTRMNSFIEKINSQKQQKDKAQANAKKINEIYVQAKYLEIPTQLKSKNARIRTISTQDNTRQNAFEDHDVAYDDYSERDFLNQNRRQVKKSQYLRNRIKTKPN